MPVTLRNTDILFNDGSTQSTAAGAPSTTQVLNATAGASTGAVGTYALCRLTASNFPAINPGETVAGSNLVYTSANSASSTAVSVGTWRAMGRTTGNVDAGDQTTVWLRIS